MTFTDSYVPPLNAGLYSGPPFWPNAEWANPYSVPDSDYLTSVQLAQAHGPIDAPYQFAPNGIRPGNNDPANPGLERCGVFLCMPSSSPVQPANNQAAVGYWNMSDNSFNGSQSERCTYLSPS